MSDFRIAQLQQSSVLYLYSIRDAIQLDPDYQRASDIWPLDKRQLLIDSLINNYDVPKLYFHEFYPAKPIDGHKYKYAIIDGKQRLESIWQFIDGDFPLADDCEYVHDDQINIKGLTYRSLAQKFPKLKAKLDSTNLTVVTIQTDDLEVIEDMFSRLNEAIPLSAPEKRNAFGGPLPKVIRQVCRSRFFTRRLPFPNTRYRHFDLATKFLYVVHRSGIIDTKKPYLDEFVRESKGRTSQDAAKLQKNCDAVLKMMSKVFTDADPLLRSVGSVMIYFFCFSRPTTTGGSETSIAKILSNSKRNESRTERLPNPTLERQIMIFWSSIASHKLLMTLSLSSSAMEFCASE